MGCCAWMGRVIISGLLSGVLPPQLDSGKMAAAKLEVVRSAGCSSCCCDSDIAGSGGLGPRGLDALAGSRPPAPPSTTARCPIGYAPAGPSIQAPAGKHSAHVLILDRRRQPLDIWSLDPPRGPLRVERRRAQTRRRLRLCEISRVSNEACGLHIGLSLSFRVSRASVPWILAIPRTAS